MIVLTHLKDVVVRGDFVDDECFVDFFIKGFLKGIASHLKEVLIWLWIDL